MPIATYRQNSFNAGVISPLLHTRVTQERYRYGCVELHNMLLYPQGGAYRRAGLQYLNKVKESSRLLPFVYNTEESYILELSHHLIRIWHNGKILCDKNGKVIEIESPYACSVLYTIQYVQTANVVYFASTYSRVCKLERMNHHEWKFSEVLFGCTKKKPTNIQYSGGEDTTEFCKIYVRGVDKEGREGETSDILVINKNPTMDKPIRYTWDSDNSEGMFHLYIQRPGEENFTLRSKSFSPSYDDYGMDERPVQYMPRIRGPYNGEGSYPTTVSLWNQRLIFAGSLFEPQTIWFSKVGDYDIFTHSPEVTDDDAIIITIASTVVEPIQWIHAHREVLFIGSALGEWSLSSSSGGIITPRNVSVRKHTSYGTCNISPIHIGDAMVFVQRDKKVLRQFQYMMEYDTFIGNDLSIVAEHITQYTNIRSFAWQQYPNPILWILLENGTLAGLTFIQEYGIFAWHTHDTKGFIESIVSIPTKDETAIYLVVKRIIEEKEVHYLEKLDTGTIENNVKKSRYIDSFLEYQGESIKTMTGLDHLEGESVYILADDTIHEPCIVENGTITLNKPANNICVGLQYTSKLIPVLHLLPQAEGKGNSIYSVLKVHITSTNTIPLYVSNGFDDTEYPSTFLSTNQRTHSLYNHTVTMPPQKTKDYSIECKQYFPVNMVILSITAEFGG